MNPETVTATGETLLARVVGAYVECALWAGQDWTLCDETLEDPEPNPVPLDDNYGSEDLSDEARAEIASECADFLAANDCEGLAPEQIGHDFYLTRNRHGAGFWDRGLGDLGDRLTEAAHVYGTSELYSGDDGKLYLHG